MNIYCIEHEKMVEAKAKDDCPVGHDHCEWNEYDGIKILEDAFCCFTEGYAYVPPPDGFRIVGRAELPSPEEIEVLDASVAELLTTWS